MRILFIILISLLFVSSIRAKTWTHKMDSLAHVTERQYNLPHGFCRAIALQESGYDSTAVREENTYFNQGSRYANQIDLESRMFINKHPDYDIPLYIERAQRSISTGMFQIMNNNIREMGYDKETINLTLEEQFHYFGIFASNLFHKYHTIEKVASCYNSGQPNHTNRPYTQHIVKYQKQFSY